MDRGRDYPEGIACAYWKRDNSGIPCWNDNIAEKMLPEIVNCHLHDNFGDKDQHDLPGRGNINWQKLKEQLSRAPRLQVIQSEVITRRNGISIKELVQTFNNIFNN